jgi:peptide-methionine (R)-S-oxide reductase
MHRRQFIAYSLAGLAAAALAPYLEATKAFAVTVVERLILSDDEWKKRLTQQQYDILREEGTEPPFTSALLNEHREGTFVCIACGLPLFPSKFKYDSGTAGRASSMPYPAIFKPRQITS